MAKKREAHDVFQFYSMHGGDRSVCWEWTGPFSDKGVPYFSYGGRKQVAYRVVFELTGGPLLPGEVVRHKCDCGQAPIGCGNPTHLERGTHQENMEDMKQRNRHGMSAYVVRAIRRLHSEGVHPYDIAKRYGIGVQTVRDIVNEKTHAHIKDDVLQPTDNGGSTTENSE